MCVCVCVCVCWKGEEYLRDGELANWDIALRAAHEDPIHDVLRVQLKDYTTKMERSTLVEGEGRQATRKKNVEIYPESTISSVARSSSSRLSNRVILSVCPLHTQREGGREGESASPRVSPSNVLKPSQTSRVHSQRRRSTRGLPPGSAHSAVVCQRRGHRSCTHYVTSSEAPST